MLSETVAGYLPQFIHQLESGAGSGDVLWDAISGRDADAREKILDAAKGGATIAALFGGPTAVAADMSVNAAAHMAEKLVHYPVESDIISTAELWEQQINEVAGIHSDEIQMVDEDNVVGNANVVEETYESAVEQIVGVKTSTGVQVNDVSTHIVERMNERQISMSSIIDALSNPLKPGAIREDGSQQFIGEKATVVINVNTGKIVTVWATKSKLAEKLRGG